jgi:hypothetical protein
LPLPSVTKLTSPGKSFDGKMIRQIQPGSTGCALGPRLPRRYNIRHTKKPRPDPSAVMTMYQRGQTVRVLWLRSEAPQHQQVSLAGPVLAQSELEVTGIKAASDCVATAAINNPNITTIYQRNRLKSVTDWTLGYGG